MAPSVLPSSHGETSSAFLRANLIFSTVPVVCLLYFLTRGIYYLYFHPLNKIPGPKLWIVFPFAKEVTRLFGIQENKMRAYHLKYGLVVRNGPNEMSFITAQAWKDIYGYGHRQFPKLVFRDPKRAPDIITANDEDHTRFRRALAHAFSEKALRDQEPLIRNYIDLLVEKLNDMVSSGEKVDMVKWYNLTTFDLMGDLAFGESFNGLRSTNIHSWVSMIYKSVKVLAFYMVMAQYPGVAALLNYCIPRGLKEARESHFQYTHDTTMKRVQNKPLHGRGDFMDSMLKKRGEKGGLTDDELVSNSQLLIIAGSETTATLLSGVTYLLLQNPRAWQKVVDEVRSAFKSEAEITFANANARLPYMLACLDEAFRVYPPVPVGVQRFTPPGSPSIVDGYSIPAGTLVSVHQSGAYLSPLNFHRPTEFIPERALPNPPPEFANDCRGVLQPFSTGPRNCIGRNLAYNEMRLILARVLWNFDMDLCEESKDWLKTQKIWGLWQKGPMWIRLSKRRDIIAPSGVHNGTM